MVKLTYVTLFVEHLELVRDWYVRHLGLAPRWESENFVLLAGDGGAHVGLHRGTPLSVPERVQLHFEVPDVATFYDRLRSRGVAFVCEPEARPWGYRVAVLRDPAGHTIELSTPL